MDVAEQPPVLDPVIESYKKHVDRTLLVENLRRSPEQRLLAMISMLELTTELREAIRNRGAPESR